MNRLGPLLTVLISLTGLVLSAHALAGVRADAAESSWLREHAAATRYRVSELGELRPDGAATAVWVQVPGGPDAFVDLRRSHQQITRAGQELGARVDERLQPAVGTGVAEDVLLRGSTSRCLSAAAPLLLTAAGALVLLRRRRRS